MDETPFTPILRGMLAEVPEAVGTVFAAWDGEAVDEVAARPSRGQSVPFDLRLFGAHWGVILNHVRSALRTFHYGDPAEMILQHERFDVLIHAVADRYYVIIALRAGCNLARALREIRRGARAIAAEM
jgi:predicted regulator of Ras-like GTPase activity (Roadblock/LC7/MglB family)